MKTLIVYASKTGTTEKCAGIIGQNLKDATIINLSARQNEDFNKYDKMPGERRNSEYSSWQECCFHSKPFPIF